MATTSNTYTGNGSNKLFSITFPYLDIGDIKVYLNNGLQTITTQYVFASITQIEFVTAPANGAVVDIRRETTIDTPEATFFIGSPVRANDLNDNNNQLLYLAQETQNSLDDIDAKAEDALDAVSAALPYTLVANLTALNALTPVLNSYYELNDSTGATTPTITSIPIGLVGSSGLTFRLRYNGTSFVFQNYYVNDSETRYLKLTGGNVTGNLSVDTDVLFVDTANNRVGINSEWARMDQDGLLLTNQRDLRLGDSDNSNYVGFQSPATVASNVVWTLPATDGTVDQVLTTDGSGTLAWASPNETRTPITLTNQTSVEFLTIPTWVKRITMTFDEISSSGTSEWLIQIGDSGTFRSAGYRGAGVRFTSSNNATVNDTNGFILPSNLAANSMSGIVTVFNANGNTWCAAGTIGGPTTSSLMTSGSKSINNILDRIRLTTVNGTDTFDNGSLNVSLAPS
jgi:hypothetical protein